MHIVPERLQLVVLLEMVFLMETRRSAVGVFPAAGTCKRNERNEGDFVVFEAPDTFCPSQGFRASTQRMCTRQGADKRPAALLKGTLKRGTKRTQTRHNRFGCKITVGNSFTH